MIDMHKRSNMSMRLKLWCQFQPLLHVSLHLCPVQLWPPQRNGSFSICTYFNDLLHSKYSLINKISIQNKNEVLMQKESQYINVKKKKKKMDSTMHHSSFLNYSGKQTHNFKWIHIPGYWKTWRCQALERGREVLESSDKFNI